MRLMGTRMWASVRFMNTMPLPTEEPAKMKVFGEDASIIAKQASARALAVMNTLTKEQHAELRRAACNEIYGITSAPVSTASCRR